MALGLEKAEFEHVGLVEWNQHARETILLNNRLKTYKHEWPLFEERDVRDVKFERFQDKVELVAGGPPCQPFSVGGVHRGDLDSRNMFPEAIRAVREIRPRAFLFENVKGLARASFRPYLEYIVDQLRMPWLRRREEEDWQTHHKRVKHAQKSGIAGDGPNYAVDWRPISCSNFGAPQIRERVIFIGFRADLGCDWSWPEPTHGPEELIFEQEISLDYWKRHGVRRPCTSEQRTLREPLCFEHSHKPWVTVRDAIKHFGPPARVKNRVSMDHGQHVHIPGAKQYPGHEGSPYDWPAKALKAGVHGVPGGENMLVNDKGEVRYFTVREAAALQGFPDNYFFAGSWGEAMRQIGNAVPAMVAEFFAKEVKRTLKASTNNKTRSVAG